MGIQLELQKLQVLYENNFIQKEEFEERKKALLLTSPEAQPSSSDSLVNVVEFEEHHHPCDLQKIMDSYSAAGFDTEHLPWSVLQTYTLELCDLLKHKVTLKEILGSQNSHSPPDGWDENEIISFKKTLKNRCKQRLLSANSTSGEDSPKVLGRHAAFLRPVETVEYNMSYLLADAEESSIESIRTVFENHAEVAENGANTYITSLLTVPDTVQKGDAVEGIVMVLRNLSLHRIPSALMSAPSLQLGHLKELNLSCNKLTTLPCEFGFAFPELEILNISHNMLAELPLSVTSLQKLVCLDAAYNFLSSLPHSIGSMQSLRQLNLFCNQLQPDKVPWGSLTALVHRDCQLDVNANASLSSIFRSDLTASALSPQSAYVLQQCNYCSAIGDGNHFASRLASPFESVCDLPLQMVGLGAREGYEDCLPAKVLPSSAEEESVPRPALESSRKWIRTPTVSWKWYHQYFEDGAYPLGAFAYSTSAAMKHVYATQQELLSRVATAPPVV